MKKIIVNGGTLVGKEIYGVQRNATELLCALDKIVEPGNIEVVIPEKGFRKLKFNNIKIRVLRDVGNTEGKLFKFKWNHMIFPRYVKKNKGLGIDLILALPLWGCDVVCICDCITELFPQNAKTFREKGGRLFYLLRVRRCIKYCKEILTISQHSKNDLIDFYHCAEKKIDIVPCAWQHFQSIQEDKTILKRLNLIEGNYFFALGSRYQHKNFKWIVSAAEQNPQYTFVVSGSNKLNTSDRMLNQSDLKNLVFTGYLLDEEVKALMRYCKAFIQPSLYEGFGMPPMEAMSVGAKCIVSSTSCLPEIYQNSVWYIDPIKYDEIRMDEIMSGSIESPGAVLDNFSWEKSAHILLEILTEKVMV